jgi:3-hydroxymyristoyl/3-hydroxydecanoyl-(acyl carrier protein) dehydratase
MPERFSAFSFVDRITVLEDGRRARGRFAIPSGLPAFSIGLVAEAVGQLAAWVAMAQAEFRRRPVAALSGETRIVGEAAPGTILDLGVEIESCDQDAVAYGGWARVADTPVLELSRCVGPMLPLEDFDAPEAVRGDFETLCGSGKPPGRFPGITAPDLSLIDHIPGQRLRASMHVPVSAPFFGDHFPRRPVFPATLLLDAHIRLALQLAGETLPAGQRLRPARLADVKMRSFILPGHAVEIEAAMRSATDEAAELTLAAMVDGKRVATGRMEIVSLEPGARQTISRGTTALPGCPERRGGWGARG